MKDNNINNSANLFESELDDLINNDRYFGSTPEDIRKLVHKVFFVHAILESDLGLRIALNLLNEQLSTPGMSACCLTETTRDLIRKLTFTERLSMVKRYKDGAPYSLLEKINSIRNDFGHPIERNWSDKYRNGKYKIEMNSIDMKSLL